MATASCLLSEDKFLCSVCLDVFTEPVSTPCGHNFCSVCIHTYWKGSDTYHCPLCQTVFPLRPELQVNTFVSELAAEFKTLVQVKASTPDPQLPGPAEVLCDICSDMKANAVKSCLTCLVSFCEAHFEPHRRVAGLKGHTVLDPVKNLDDRMCKTHSKITELYCRTDRAFICASCLTADHESHKVVSLDEEYEAKMAKVNETKSNIQKMALLRCKSIVEIERSIDVSQTGAEKEKEASVQVFQDLLRSVQRSQAEVVAAIEESHRKTKQKAEDLIGELRMEVADLTSRSKQLERLSQFKDRHYFLQSFPDLCRPPDGEYANVWVHSDPSFQAVRSTVTELKQRVEEIIEELPENKRQRMREHAVHLTFDPGTASPSLVISEDRKQVRIADKVQIPSFGLRTTNTFGRGRIADVLAKEGFTTGKFYYEVQVEGNTAWIVGVVRESVAGLGNKALTEENGAWPIGLVGGKYFAFTSPRTELTPKEKPQKVGIFVDYDKREVSFFDANTKSHIHSFTGCNFTEKLYPFFDFNKTAEGLFVLTPVPQMD